MRAVASAFVSGAKIDATSFEETGTTTVKAELSLTLCGDAFCYEEQLGGKAVETPKTKDGIILPVSGRRYFSASVPKEQLIRAFEKATFIEE